MTTRRDNGPETREPLYKHRIYCMRYTRESKNNSAHTVKKKKKKKIKKKHVNMNKKKKKKKKNRLSTRNIRH